MLQLHTFSHSSASYRVRIALALKGVASESHAVSLIANDHLSEAYQALNPEGRVPAIVTEQGVLTQSFASFVSLVSLLPLQCSKLSVCNKGEPRC